MQVKFIISLFCQVGSGAFYGALIFMLFGGETQQWEHLAPLPHIPFCQVGSGAFYGALIFMLFGGSAQQWEHLGTVPPIPFSYIPLPEQDYRQVLWVGATVGASWDRTSYSFF